jgi:hypothetical protein
MDNQGKRPDQIKFSEQVVFYSILVLFVIFVVTLLIK